MRFIGFSVSTIASPMPKCAADQMSFGHLGRREIEANFEGGALSSDGGLTVLRQVDTANDIARLVNELTSAENGVVVFASRPARKLRRKARNGTTAPSPRPRWKASPAGPTSTATA